MEPCAHIQSLTDDLLIRILWHSANPGTCLFESDAIWTSLHHKPRYLHPHRLPGFDSPAYQPHLALTNQFFATSAGYHLLIASVCRRWRRLAQLSVSTLSVRSNLDVPLEFLATAVACFPNLTSLRLCDCSVGTVSDDFLDRLASSCPNLTSLHIGSIFTFVNHGISKENHPVTESGLDRLFQHCTQLKQLSFFCLRENMDLPASFFRLAHLHSLTLTTPLMLESPHLASLSSLTALRIASCYLKSKQFANLLRLPSITNLSISDETQISLRDQLAAALILPQLPLLTLECSLTIPSHLPCSRLERLLISNSDQLEQLPGNIAELLPCLRELSIRGCEKFSHLPEGVTSLSVLESLTISSCCSFSSLPENFGQLAALKTLVLEMLPLEKLLDSFCCHPTFLENSTSHLSEQLIFPTSLTSLTISTCRKLTNLPENFGQLPALRTLVLDNLTLTNLSDSFSLLTSLETLFILDCEEIEQLPAGFCSLTALTTLCLVRLWEVKLPEDIGALLQLHTLLLDGNSQEQLLPPSFTQLRCLTRLELNRCQIESLPEGMGNLSSLQQLHVDSCGQLSELPVSISALGCLRILTVHSCQRLSLAPISLDGLTRLKHLEITDCQSLPESVQFLPPFLEKLSLATSDSTAPLVTIPMLTELKHLKLSWVCVDGALEFSESLSCLKHLELFLEKTATELPFPLASLRQLRTLAIFHAGKIPSLPESIGAALQELRELKIQNAADLAELPESIVKLKQLTSLEVHACSCLASLPEGTGALTRLRKLNVSDCKALMQLPASLTRLACLTELDLSATRVNSLPPNFGQLSSLRRLVLDGCWRLRALPCDMAELKMLLYLGVKRCRQLLDREGYVQPRSLYTSNSLLQIGLK